ncbi:MAG TPA: chemoreceptor glutamine deamidase CheD [Hydrogenophaga sp.]|uniref:chemoreceptor glutamine deamidase CheD n=1 Tax=Hydrogenophaga sp. TaxID=1904254 RepID=UPI002C27E842|nr:chemoreceptor glutamine deamidase CheD [Hydrogenophaga sp.]HSX92101.1 chemoreceptor glutamine deamidase CheD [Hydrogenophaga sp.]
MSASSLASIPPLAPLKPLSSLSLPRVQPAAGVVSRVDELKARTPKPGEASFFFHEPHFRSDAVKVLPGEYYVTTDELVIMTVLGSCIAACIWDPKVRVGGMNHFMLPEGGSDSGGRYGSYAMELLINEMMKLGARRESMQAKVFGGGAVMSSFTTMNVGERNTKFVLDYLQTERIAVVSKDVLDIHPRKVCFFPVSGKAMVKRLAHTQPETLETQERKGSAAVVAKANAGGSIDLF